MTAAAPDAEWKAHATRHRRLSQFYDWTLKRLLEPSGWTHAAPVNGATLATVLGLVLACLTASVCGLGHLPRLLIHDSPEEGDMELIHYERVFMLVLELERTFGQHPPSFRYSVSTTTPPPPEVGWGLAHLYRVPLSPFCGPLALPGGSAGIRSAEVVGTRQASASLLSSSVTRGSCGTHFLARRASFR